MACVDHDVVDARRLRESRSWVLFWAISSRFARRFLRAQQLYSDCVYERQEHIREKEVMKLWEKEKEKAYHEDVMRHVAEGDRREAAELEARKLKNAVICKQQQAQLAEFRENYLERLRIEKRDGELIQKKVARLSVSLVASGAFLDPPRHRRERTPRLTRR